MQGRHPFCPLLPALVMLTMVVGRASRSALRGVARLSLAAGALLLLAACAVTLPEPPPANLPTQPAVLEITPAPTLDIDATATVMAEQLRPTPTPAGLYIVQSGDTLSSLAERFNTTVEELLVANDLNDPNDLQQGQELIIPSLLPTAEIGADAEPETDAEPDAEETSTPQAETDDAPTPEGEGEAEADEGEGES